MANVPYEAPELQKTGFNCLECRAFSTHTWFDVVLKSGDLAASYYPNAMVAVCKRCEAHSFWLSGTLIYPDDVGIAPPNSDLAESIQADYLEARSILNRSPRGAAALLRLALQKLCFQLGERGRDINDDIAALVQRGLPVMIQQGLDILRVVGNNAVHPGQIDLNDDRGIAIALFGVLNKIADVMITDPKQIQALFESLPQTALDQIEKRDSAN